MAGPTAFGAVSVASLRLKTPRWIIAAAFGTLSFGSVCIAFVAGLQNALSQPSSAKPPPTVVSTPVSSETSPSPQERPLDLPALAKKARRAVVFIVCSDASGEIKTGSGFFVSQDGRLVTNEHVIDGAVSAQAKLGVVGMAPNELDAGSYCSFVQISLVPVASESKKQLQR